MSNHHIALASAAALFVFLFIVGFIPTPQDPIDRLRLRFFDLSRLPRADAIDELDPRIQSLTKRFPGKSYRWYLQWLVRDLERAKEL